MISGSSSSPSEKTGPLATCPSSVRESKQAQRHIQATEIGGCGRRMARTCVVWHDEHELACHCIQAQYRSPEDC